MKLGYEGLFSAVETIDDIKNGLDNEELSYTMVIYKTIDVMDSTNIVFNKQWLAFLYANKGINTSIDIFINELNNTLNTGSKYSLITASTVVDLNNRNYSSKNINSIAEVTNKDLILNLSHVMGIRSAMDITKVWLSLFKGGKK